MTKKVEDGNSSHSGEGRPHRVRLPGFVSNEEIGLGDGIKRVTLYFGARPCGDCERRRVALNRWMTFGGGPHK
jgi:hypothetical protein